MSASDEWVEVSNPAVAKGYGEASRVQGSGFGSGFGSVEGEGEVLGVGGQGRLRAIADSAHPAATGRLTFALWDAVNGTVYLGTVIDDTCVTDCYSGAYAINEAGVITGAGTWMEREHV